MEGMYNYGHDPEDRKVEPQDDQEPDNVSTGPVVERGHRSRRGCRPRRRRSQRRKCICKSRRRRRKRRKLRLSSNPFLIFYLEMYFKSPGRPVTQVAREAGRKWCALPDKQKEKYIRLAKKVKCRCRRRRK